MTVPYNIDSSAAHYKNYYSNQAGGGISVFQGKTIQHGSGLGGVFSKVFKGIAPVLKQAAKTAGKQLLTTGGQIAQDIINGQRFSQSAKKNLSKGGNRLLAELSKSMLTPKVSGAKRKANEQKRKSTKTKKRRLSKNIFQ